MNKLLIPTIIILAIAIGIGAFFFFQKSALPKPPKVPTLSPATQKSIFPQSQKIQIIPPATQDKFSLWQEPSFFRGAAIHPYAPYGLAENRIYVTKEDFRALKNYGANVISLNYPGPFTPTDPYALDKEALSWLDNAVNWAEKIGLYVIIHFRNGPGKSEETFWGADEKEDEFFWYSAEAQAKWVEMWKFVAERYRGRPYVIAYNLMVEPHPEHTIKQEPLDAKAWKELATRITAGIRDVDPDTPIIVGATAWSNPLAFSELKPIEDSRVIYSFHMYEPFEFTHQGFAWIGKENVPALTYPGMIPSDIYEETRYWNKELLNELLQPVIDFQTAHQAPIFIGEFGCNRRVPSCINYLDDLMSIFEEHGWGYTFYVWRVDDGFDYEKEAADGERVLESQYMKLFKKYWNKNQYFQQPARSSSQTPPQQFQATPIKSPTTNIEKDDYIAKAFIRAYKADPNAILRYNEGWDLHRNRARFDGSRRS